MKLFSTVSKNENNIVQDEIDAQEIEPQNSGFKKFILKNADIIRTVVTTEIIFVVLFTVFLANCIVPTASMEPTIMSGSRIIANRLAYKNEKPERYDVIAFKFPDDEKFVFCKRIIGLPGETLEIVSGKTYINGVEIPEEFITYSFTGDYGPFYIPKQGDIVQYHNETDTVTFGNIVIGNAKFLEKYCYMGEDNKIYVKQDCYFCLGDNRDNSEDARFWNNKYVTEDKIIGKMWLNISEGFSEVK